MAPRCCGFAALRCILVLLNTIYIVSSPLLLLQNKSQLAFYNLFVSAGHSFIFGGISHCCPYSGLQLHQHPDSDRHRHCGRLSLCRCHPGPGWDPPSQHDHHVLCILSHRRRSHSVHERLEAFDTVQVWAIDGSVVTNLKVKSLHSETSSKKKTQPLGLGSKCTRDQRPLYRVLVWVSEQKCFSDTTSKARASARASLRKGHNTCFLA